MVKVQWRVLFLATVMLAGWLSAAESNRRKVIIHIPHLHHAHKHTVRHVQKGQSHGKTNGKGNGHMHKHHHHFYDDEHGDHGSHSHVYEDSGHHHHHHPPPPPPPPPPTTHHHHPHHHHHSDHPPHHPPHHHHHSDHHGHGSHHMEHHRHPDHHDEMDHLHHLRTDESMYSYEHHYPDHTHHRLNHYSNHHHHPSTRSYDCMEICEKCRMKANRHRYSVSRGHDVTRSSSGIPQSVSSKSPSPPPPTSPAPNGHHQGYLVSEAQDFKPVLAPGELSVTADGYGPGYMFPRPLEVLPPSPGKLSSPGRKPVHYEDQAADYDSAFPEFPDFVPDTRGWYNETFFYGKHEDPGVKMVGYHRQRGQQVQQRGKMRYNEDGLVNGDEGSRKERGRDLRYHNRHRYETVNR